MQPTLMIMAGGTGGHVFPALAVAQYLSDRGWDIIWIGTPYGLENQIIPKYDIPLVHIDIAGVRKSGIMRWIKLPFTLLRAFWQAMRLIQKHNPTVLLGMGGFTSFPGGFMARLLGKPLLIHEQNAVAGLANRILSKFAIGTLVAYPNAFTQSLPVQSGFKSWLKKTFYPQKVIHVGNPVRRDLVELASRMDPESRLKDRSGPLRMLIVGGSRGAQALNDVVPEALKLLPHAFHPKILHQAGATLHESVKAHYAEVELSPQSVVTVQAFIDNMSEAYAWCDFVLCRSGALTLAEITALGIASILVPYPHAVDDHQTYNARFLSDAGAAMLIPQNELTPQRLATLLQTVTRKDLMQMAKKSRQLAKIQATEEVATLCERFLTLK